MPTRLITFEEAVPFITWPGAVGALRQGHSLPRPQQGDLLLNASRGKLLNRAASVERLGFAVKADSIFPQNSEAGMPTVQGAVILFDARNGAVRAVIDSKIITQYKTAADSVLGATCLARADSRHLLILGAGAVAATLAQAYAAIFPDLERVTIWSRRPEQSIALAERLKGLPVLVEPSHNLPGAVGTADIVATATMAQEPILKSEWVKPGTHVDLIGAYTPDMREADDQLIASGRVYVDCIDTVVDHIGEVMKPIEAGVIQRSHILGDLYDLVAANRSSRASEEEITVFKNGGGAHLDLMMADYVARAVGLA